MKNTQDFICEGLVIIMSRQQLQRDGAETNFKQMSLSSSNILKKQHKADEEN